MSRGLTNAFLARVVGTARVVRGECDPDQLIPSLLGGLPTIRRERVQFPYEKLVTAQGEMGPGLSVADLHLVEQLELLGVGLDEQKNPPLVQGENSIPLSDQAAILAKAFRGPRALPCLQVNSCETLVLQMQISVTADDYGR